jgi:hypothetical protein
LWSKAKKLIMKRTFLFFAFILLINVSLLAQESTPKVDARQNTQQERIQQGKQSGEISRREAARVRKEQKHIRRTERRAKADGDVTAAERRKIDRKQDRASRHIHRANTNEAKSK